MPLLGQAAMLLAFDVAADAVDDHDDWHSHEHLPERLAIPGFLRGTRWVAASGAPRYVVVYEVETLATLTSDAYLQRLNRPTPWTTKLMAHYRGMRRGLCNVVASHGRGVAGWAAVLRCTPPADAAGDALRRVWDDALPALAAQRGLSGAHRLEGAAAAPMTHEQRLRGADAGVDAAVVVTGYAHDAVAALAASDGLAATAAAHGATSIAVDVLRLADTLTAAEASG